MPLPTYYAAGTASVANGDTTVTFSGALLGTIVDQNIMAGDLFLDPAQPEIPPQRIASIDYAAGTAELFADWPGATMSDAPYEVRYVGMLERSTAQNRRYLELAGQLKALGIQPNAFGEFADREVYDDERKGFIFLSLDGDGDENTAWRLYAKLSADSGDWDAGQTVEGAEGPQGPSALAGVWRGAYSGATAYAKNDIVLYQGSSWIALQATTGNAPPTLPTTADAYWELTAAAGTDGAPGNDGAPGSDGEDGVGVPVGGSAGQVLAKASGADHDTEWVDQSGGREVLTANRTYYVRTDGSDSNDGLANTSGRAWLSLQHAMDVIAASLDLGGHVVTIKVASGTYTAGVALKAVAGQGSTAGLVFEGDTSTPADVLVDVPNGACFFGSGPNVQATVRGFKLDAGTGNCIQVTLGAYIDFSSIDFAGAANHLRGASGGFIRATGNYNISASASQHMSFETAASVVTFGRTVTIASTPSFTTFASFATASIGNCGGMTFSGSATGARYLVSGNAVLSTNGGGASYFPGDGVGSVATGGQYL